MIENEYRPLVKNAADPVQVKKSKKKSGLDRKQELLDLEYLLSLPEGRRVFWRLLGKAGMFRSIWEPSAKIHYNSGKQDYGFWLFGEIEQASQDFMLAMMRENKKGNEDV